MAFCNKLSEREGWKPCHGADGQLLATGTGYRLPTEAEWEYAYRAGTDTAFAFGDQLALTDANFAGGSPSGTVQVGSDRANRFGLYDMHGNVWEWCNDLYSEKYYKLSLVDDQPGPAEAPDRVIRGGSWRDSPRPAHSVFRICYFPEDSNAFVGFRVARVLSGL